MLLRKQCREQANLKEQIADQRLRDVEMLRRLKERIEVLETKIAEQRRWKESYEEQDMVEEKQEVKKRKKEKDRVLPHRHLRWRLLQQRSKKGGRKRREDQESE